MRSPHSKDRMASLEQLAELGRLVGRITMRYAAFLILPTTLTLCTNYSALAQQDFSSGPSLVLVKGDTPNSSTPSCSFISITELKPIPIVQGLLFVQLGDSPDRVEAKVGFSPDQPYTNDVLQWTAIKGGNYVRAMVNFRNNGALKRSFMMANNYKQPNEKQCQWEVQEQQNQDSQSLMQSPANLVNQLNTSCCGATLNGSLIRGNVTYPQGSRINADGIISSPRGERTIPSVSVKHGNGSTSYYYRNGSRITIKPTTIPPTGTLIR